MICFDIELFKVWLEHQGCDCCCGCLILKDNKIIYKWESNINGVFKKHEDTELEGVIIEDEL